MRLDVFLLAEAAVVQQGKLYIHGGGLSEIEAPIVPWTHPQLAVVMRLAASPEESTREHEVALTILAPESTEIFPRYPLRLPDFHAPRMEGGEPVVDLVLTFSPITFEREGMHHVLLEVDGQVVRALPVAVIRSQQPAY